MDPKEGTSKDSSEEEKMLAVRKQRKILRGKMTRTMNRLSDYIELKVQNPKRFERELETLRVDFSNICIVHYEYVEEHEHPKLDEWESELISAMHETEDKVEHYLELQKGHTHEDAGGNIHSKDGQFKDQKSAAAVDTSQNLDDSIESSEENHGPTNMEDNHSVPARVSGPSNLMLGSTPTSADQTVFDKWIVDLVEFEETKFPNIPDTMSISEALYKLEAAKDIPTITLKKFDGNPLEYVDFVERFRIHIHEKAHLTDDVRMVQLLMHLHGDASRAVSPLGSSGIMYATALKLLKDQFGHPSLIARSFINKLVNGSKIVPNNRNSLKDLSLDLIASIATLKRLNYFADVNSNDILRKIIARLPSHLIDKWKVVAADLREKGEVPSVIHISDFVRKRVKAEFDPDFGDIDKSRGDLARPQNNFPRKPAVNSQQPAGRFEKICPVCGKDHRVSDCPVFKDSQVTDRIELIKKHQLCFSCLNKGHIARRCRFKRICGEGHCIRTHHRLLHTEPPSSNSVTSVLDYHCMLPVVRALFRAPNGRICQGNVLTDGGAGTTIIRKGFSIALGLQGKVECLDISVVGGETVKQSNSRRVHCKLSPLEGGEEFDIEAFELDNTVEDVPNLDKAWLKSFSYLRDIEFSCKGGPIDLILGVQYSHIQADEEIRQGLPFEPVAKRSKLGWYVMGADTVQRVSPVCAVQVMQKVDFQKMYDFETLGIQAPNCQCPREIYSSEDRKALDMLASSCQRIGNRYEIGLPWKRDPQELPNNYSMAEKRLYSLERGLLKNEAKASLYSKAISEYVEKGFAVRLEDKDIHRESFPVYYLPHHGVYRPDKPSTPLRVVFDPASEFQGVSLNSFLYKGPCMIGDLYGVLIRFREDYTAVVGDISKMYLQILLPESDTDVHRYLWRDLDTSRKPDVYKLLRVAFGDKPSPNMASYVMLRIASENKNSHPDGAVILERDRYMDDLIHSCPSDDIAVERVRQVDDILASGSFQIKKWYSSSVNVLNILEPNREHDGKESIDLDKEEIKTLGVVWKPKHDILTFSVKDVQLVQFTKRSVLSKLSMLYDPLGLASAVTIRSRIALQDVWKSRTLGWDHPMPEDMSHLWQELFTNLNKLSCVEFPRCLKPNDVISGSELHVFADASVRAYGAVAYQRWETSRGYEVRLVSAKAKVAPLHHTTIPRLELMAALVASRLAKSLVSNFKEQPRDVILWTDSKIVYYWVQAESVNFKQFVGVRIAEIQSFWKPEQWRFVPSDQNPADDLSRGISVEEINGRWMHGPDFLKLDSEQWPKDSDKTKLEESALEKRNSKVVTFCDTSSPAIDPERFSNWSRLVRVTGYCLRFIDKLHAKVRGQAYKHPGPCLQPEEINGAETYWVKFAQLSLGNWKTTLTDLAPFQRDGVIRAGGRLRQTSLQYDQVHPIILPAKHQIAKLIMRDVHEKLCHVGPERTLSESRRKYWIIRGRSMAKGIVRNCVTCRKLRQPVHQTLMSDLPAERLYPFSPPFTVTGVYLFGPFKLKYGRNKSIKAWGAIFSCASVRAIHLEIVADLSTQAFLQALRRFAAHHGWPQTIISDNGTSFVGAKRELKVLLQEGRKQIEEFAVLHKLKWKFITPLSPHQGGLYESLIKQVKCALQVVVGQQLLSWDEMSTVFAEVECLVNSRPLTRMSSDPNDLQPITPNNFVLGRASTEIPQGPFQEMTNLQKRFKFVQCLVQQVWKRFLREYVPTLMKRVKWQTKGRQLQVGDMVLLVDINSPRGKWDLARILEVFPGKDGIVRNVKVKTSSGVYQRSVQKCCLILEENSSSQ
ncbi:uncharacterized protein [Haliotis asinina]|uniref:uncharacterized protein n=1 Tax=Haliotis asinina TaxID=109174 RepID=UPI003531CD6D